MSRRESVQRAGGRGASEAESANDDERDNADADAADDQRAAARMSAAMLSAQTGVQMKPIPEALSDRDRAVQLSRRAVQRMEPSPEVLSTEADASVAVQTAASEGVAGQGQQLPFIGQIQRSFGRHDLSSVRAHTDVEAGAACETIGASAYATGQEIAFAGTPDLHTTAHEAAHAVQQRGGVQLSGGVGQTGDVYEQHADEVADRVVRGESAESLLDEHASVPAQPAVQRRGEPTIRKGSKGATVKELQQRLNAKGAEPPLLIDGDFGPKTKTAVVGFQNSHKDGEGGALTPDGIVGKLTWGAINDEHEAPEIENEEAALGGRLVDRMNENNQDPHTATQGVHYDFNFKANFPDEWKDDYSDGYADPQLFDRNGWMDWRLKPGVSASAGIQSWLRGLTIAECNSAIVAMQTDAVRAAIGDARFDEHFGSTDKVVPEDQRMRIKTGTDGTVVEGMNKATDAASKNDGGTFGKRPVAAGDWCYFYNHPQYLLKHPGGAFQGENALFMGANEAGKQLWSGMGVDNATEAHMLDAMMGAYNTPRDEWDDKELERIKAENGGTLPPEYDESSGVFPPTLSDVSEILSAPEYEIDGVKRKGGFIDDIPTRLDTTKIEALK